MKLTAVYLEIPHTDTARFQEQAFLSGEGNRTAAAIRLRWRELIMLNPVKSPPEDAQLKGHEELLHTRRGN